MESIAFVILHYVTYNDTIECVRSILQNEKLKKICRIVVIDNGSPNDSYRLLREEFQKDEYKMGGVVLIKAEKNLGFAKGNDLGYLYAKKILGCDFIFCINNDTLIKQERFCDIVYEKWIELHYDVMGPDIISLRDYKHQNPLGEYTPATGRMLLKECVKLLLLWIRDSLGLTKIRIQKKQQRDSIYKKSEMIEPIMKVKLMGAAVCFSPSYVKKYDYAFDPITFMYREEDFLAWRIERDKLKAAYISEIEIWHKEYSSTESAMEHKTKMQLAFKDKNMLISTLRLIYRKYMNTNVDLGALENLLDRKENDNE